QRGGEFKNIARAAAAQRGDGVELRFLDRHDLAERAEKGVDDGAVGGGQRLERGPGGDAGADLAGRIGHGADEIAGLRKGLGETGEALAGENGEDELAGGERGEAGVEARELLGLAGEDDGVGAFQQRRQIMVGGDAGAGGELLGGIIIAAGAGEVGGAGGFFDEQAVDYSRGHAAGAEEGEFHSECVLKGFSTGWRRKALVPPPSRSRRRTSPPKLCKTCRAMVRPMPTPTVRLVLTNGSNMVSRTLGLIPLPSSSTRIWMNWPSLGFSTSSVWMEMGRGPSGFVP